MTTVINFNFLNFFRPEPDSTKVGNRHNTGSAQQNRDTGPEKEVVVDITPFCRVVSDNETDDKRTYKSPAHTNPEARAAFSLPSKNMTYDRRGNAIHCSQPKGLNVDAYI